MSTHKTFFGKIFGWIGDIFHHANEGLLKVAVNLTEKLKDALKSDVIDIITSIIPTDIDKDIVAFLRTNLPKILAKELLVQAVVDNPTEEEAQDLAQQILDAFGVLNDADRSAFYTSVAAKIYIFLQEHKGHKVTFGEAAALVESAYQSWLKMKTDEEGNV